MHHFTKADFASILGTIQFGQHSHLAQGVVVRAVSEGVMIDNHSVVLENSVVVGHPQMQTRIGRKVVFGHRNTVIGATVGDLCEIGNNCFMLPGSKIGNYCTLGEGTLIPDRESRCGGETTGQFSGLCGNRRVAGQTG